MDKYHLCVTTQCQVYKPPKITNKNIQKAIEATSNLILTYRNQPINAFYHVLMVAYLLLQESLGKIKIILILIQSLMVLNH